MPTEQLTDTDLQEALLHGQEIYGLLKHYNPEAILEFKFLHAWKKNPKTGNKSAHWIYRKVNEVDDRLIADIITKNLQEYDCYYSVNPRSKKQRKSGGSADIDCAVAVWLDFDNVPPSYIETVKKHLPLEPTAIYYSGGGIHAYLRFTESTASIDLTSRFYAWIRKNTPLVPDEKCIDGARVMRLPGTKNWTHGRCSLMEESGITHKVDEVKKFLSHSPWDARKNLPHTTHSPCTASNDAIPEKNKEARLKTPTKQLNQRTTLVANNTYSILDVVPDNFNLIMNEIIKKIEIKEPGTRNKLIADLVVRMRSTFGNIPAEVAADGCDQWFERWSSRTSGDHSKESNRAEFLYCWNNMPWAKGQYWDHAEIVPHPNNNFTGSTKKLLDLLWSAQIHNGGDFFMSQPTICRLMGFRSTRAASYQIKKIRGSGYLEVIQPGTYKDLQATVYRVYEHPTPQTRQQTKKPDTVEKPEFDHEAIRKRCKELAAKKEREVHGRQNSADLRRGICQENHSCDQAAMLNLRLGSGVSHEQARRQCVPGVHRVADMPCGDNRHQEDGSVPTQECTGIAPPHRGRRADIERDIGVSSSSEGRPEAYEVPDQVPAG